MQTIESRPSEGPGEKDELGLRGLVEIATGYQRAQVLFSANDLGLFRALSTGPETIDGLAARLEVKPRALRPLLAACTALGLVRWDGSMYANSRTTGLFLAHEKPSSFSPVLRFWQRFSYGIWGRLTNAVLEAQPQTSHGTKEGDLFDELAKDDQQVEIFFGGLAGLARWPAQRVADLVDLSTCQHLVDVGGGSGVHAQALLHRHPHLKVTIFDLPSTCRFAKHRLESGIDPARLSFVEGDFHKNELPECDALLLSNVLHDWNADEALSLLARAHRALEPGGMLIIHDFMPEDQMDSIEAPLFSLALLLDTKQGRVYTRDEHLEWLGQLGFVACSVHEVGAGTRVMTARKAGP